MNDKAIERVRRYRELIEFKRQEMESAGPVHKRDLQRMINTMEKELRTYIRYQREASISG